MADADWRKYKPLRGNDLPETIAFQGTSYARQQLFKRDFYAAVGLYQRESMLAALPEQVLLKIYHTDPLWCLPLGWMGRWLAQRERRAYETLAEVAGVPRLLTGWGDSGFLREFIPGCNLREYRRKVRPDVRFYEDLLRILAAVHARGLSHNDLAKPENILVTESGAPILIDFQIALGPCASTWPLFGGLERAVVRYMQGVDRYHLHKHYTHDCREAFTAEEFERARRKDALQRFHGRVIRTPYRAVRHFVLKRWLLKDEADRAA